ncbi:hypothetical protein MA16_Dca027989 [Dendrobium catenatum]|uniref:Uncharacterized protein n=1 Tax=Dendrobium catenatum TaxID=906689 RepID=A0A2I0VBS3_9ASPA|nr:hypothetical protein MA16_Dca027989 [Dendrobium catenatum]
MLNLMAPKMFLPMSIFIRLERLQILYYIPITRIRNGSNPMKLLFFQLLQRMILPTGSRPLFTFMIQ